MKNLISPDYRKVLAWEHNNTPGQWGHTAEMHVSEIIQHADGRLNWLDYGAGSGGLSRAVSAMHQGIFSISEYEPSRENSSIPEPAEFVVCIDVLEHVEPDLIHYVLDDLQRVTIDKGFFTISCRPAKKVLHDGRNAHLIIESPEWWMPLLSCRFNIYSTKYDTRDKNLKVVVYKST